MNRRDGIKVKNLDGMHTLMLEIMPKRCDSDVYISAKIDVTNLVEYVNKLKKKKEYENLTYFHTFCIAIGKLIYNRPLLNRFIINKTFYDRKYISLGFVAKKEFTDHSEEVFTSIRINKDDNLYASPTNLNLKDFNIIRNGLKIGSLNKNNFIPDYHLSHFLSSNESIELNEHELKNYLNGQVINKDYQNGFYVVSYNNINIGFVKSVNGILKNHFPKGLRI